MFGRSRAEVVLTETTCNKLENLRLAIEVLTGKRVRFRQIDFGTKRGQIYVDDEMMNFEFIITEFFHLQNDAEYNVNIGKLGWHCATFYDSNKVRIIHQGPGLTSKWWVGTSMSDRKEEPF